MEAYVKWMRILGFTLSTLKTEGDSVIIAKNFLPFCNPILGHTKRKYQCFLNKNSLFADVAIVGWNCSKISPLVRRNNPLEGAEKPQTLGTEPNGGGAANLSATVFVNV